MKKMMVLAVTLMLVLTGCGNTKAEEAGVTSNYVISEAQSKCFDVGKFYEEHYDEERIELMKTETITMLESDEIVSEYGEDFVNEMVDLVNSIEYDRHYACGFDQERVEIGLVNALVKYCGAPFKFYGKTFDEIGVVTVYEYY